MASVSREVARDALTTLLDAALVGVGLPVQAVYGYQRGDFQGQSPVVTVSSGPIMRELQSMGACWTDTLQLYVHVFVLYSDEDSWGEDDAEDALDDIEALVADVVLANRSTANWDSLRYAEETQPGGVEIGGVEYRYEFIPLECVLRENG
jgi:hypothetical protein